MNDENNDAQIVFGRKFPFQQKRVGMSGSFVSQGVGGGKKDSPKSVSTSSDLFFRELNFFNFELILLIIVLIVCITGLFIANLVILDRLNSIKPMVNNLAFEKINFVFSDVFYMMLLFVAIPLIIMFGLFFFKFFVFHPRGKKVIVVRAWKSGLTRFSVESINGNHLKFDNAPNGDEVWVGNVKKNWEFSTGRPVVLLEEGEPENTYLNKSNKTPEKIRDENNVRASIWATATRIAEYNLRKKDTFLSSTNILILILIAIIVTIAIIFIMQPGKILEQATAPTGGNVVAPVASLAIPFFRRWF